ncbi:MAG: histidine kinase dimerization/phospho-acceptor domain-containing protein [Gemmatimonadaceae bacterium]
MGESYSGRVANGVAPATAATNVAVVSEPTRPPDARDLIAQLMPGVDAHRLIRALMAERQPADSVPGEVPRYDSDAEVCARELRRVRAQLSLGEAARTLQHAFNNPLTALMAEAQLLEFEALPDEARGAVRRILDLTRRLATLTRKLGEDDTRVG